MSHFNPFTSHQTHRCHNSPVVGYATQPLHPVIIKETGKLLMQKKTLN